MAVPAAGEGAVPLDGEGIEGAGVGPDADGAGDSWTAGVADVLEAVGIEEFGPEDAGVADAGVGDAVDGAADPGVESPMV